MPENITLPNVERSTPLPGWCSGDRSVRRLMGEGTRVVALCHASLEVHELDLSRFELHSRAVDNKEIERLTTPTAEVDPDALEDGRIVAAGGVDLALAGRPEISRIVAVPGGFLLQLDGQVYKSLSTTGDLADPGLPDWGELPSVCGDRVLVPYGAHERRGWVLWNAASRTIEASALSQEGPYCTAALLTPTHRILAWATASDGFDADVAWLEVVERAPG